MMDFCDECDALLIPRKLKGKVLPFCPDCDEFKQDGVIENISITDEKNASDPEGGKMLILENQSNATVGRPSKEMYCSRCELMQMVEYWEIQTRSADESPTRFFKCLNCEKNWREYD